MVMRRAARVLAIAAAAVALSAGGCAATPALTQSQLNAIETRVVEAAFDETFDAASGALFDAGYIIAMSDRTGGLLTGTQVIEASAWDQFWGASPYAKHLAISVKVWAESARQSLIRIKTQVNGRTKVDQVAINEIWVLMQRQVLMTAPLEPEPEPETAPDPDPGNAGEPDP